MPLYEYLCVRCKHKFERIDKFTARKTRRAYLAPASHAASKDGDVSLPPMGLRVRLKSSYPVAGDQIIQNILVGLKKYGMILADNGSDFYFQGDPDPGWTDVLPADMAPASATVNLTVTYSATSAAKMRLR